MSMSATDANSSRPATASAWLVVLVIGLIAVAVVVTFSFSASNERASIDGRTATTSQHVEGP